MADIKGIFLQDGVVLVTNVSPDRKAATVNIEKLRVAQGSIPGPLTSIKSATVHIPVDDADSDVTVRQIVRGSASVTPGARGLILAQLGGATHQIPLPTAGSSDDAFQFESEAVVPAGRVYQASFLLLLERDADRPEIGGDLAVESLNVEFLPTTCKPA